MKKQLKHLEVDYSTFKDKKEEFLKNISDDPYLMQALKALGDK